MKKSKKKLKSERINGLIKQYDTFLEEDKKRKERNEFILGRLDEMRYCSTALQARCTVNSPILRQLPHEQIAYNPKPVVRSLNQVSQIKRPNLPLAAPINHALEETVLQELRRKYILIPKILTIPSNESDTIVNITDIKSKQMIDNDNNDWKSKYDILDKLKQEDYQIDTGGPINKEIYSQNLENENIQNSDVDAKKYENDLKYTHEIPEKDTTKGSSDLSTIKKHDNTDSYKKIDTIADLEQNPKYESTKDKIESNITEKTQHLNMIGELETNNETDIDNCIEENLAPVTKKAYITQPELEVCSEPQLNVYDNSNNYLDYQTEINKCDTNVLLTEVNEENADNENTTYFSEGITPVEGTISDNLAKEVSNEIEPQTMCEFRTEIAESQDYIPNDNVKPEDRVISNPENNVLSNHATIDIANSEPVPENVVIQEHTENSYDATDIEAFNAEQSEMFYSEQNEYDPNVDNGYTAGYTQNENFQQDEQYAYYQGQQEQSYPNEINEHEETSQRYDPSYQEQYAYEQEGYGEQDEPQPQVYDQQQFDQNPEQGMNYNQTEHQQEYTEFQYEQQNFEPETHIEQQLNNEEGYADDKQNEEQTEIEKQLSEQVANVTTS